ncbi:MAG: serine/threonine-protein kinase [Deltaproteobacteria bacterium]|nr:serine/threonine-protein kinase [Deltaproteobacteria bacterium]
MKDSELEARLARQDIDFPMRSHVRASLKARLFGGDKRATTLDRFQLGRMLGMGGMGTVYEAIDLELDRPVAVKLVRDRLSEADDHRLRREAQALAKLSHPNVVQVYDAGQAGDQVFIVMELVRGMTLSSWQHGRPDWRSCLAAYRQAGMGLAAAHQAGLVHRDFKPANCIRDDAGRVRVLDFGLACNAVVPCSEGENRAFDQRLGRITETGALAGTRAYMAPEQRSGLAVDARSDQFSFCVALFEALYGQGPFLESHDGTLSNSDEFQHILAPRPRGSDVPRSLRLVLLRGLEYQPQARWSSMDELVGELDRCRRRGRRVRVMLGAAVCVGLGASLTSDSRPDLEQRCEMSSHQYFDFWSEDARETLRTSYFEQADSSDPAPVAYVERQLDQLAAGAKRAYLGTCMASARAPSDFALEMECLHDVEARANTILEAMLDSNSGILVDRAAVIADLPRPHECDDIQQWKISARWRGDGRDNAPDAETKAARLHLVRAAAMQRAGNNSAPLEIARQSLTLAEERGHAPLRAEALLVEGTSLGELGRWRDAQSVLRAGFAVALEHGLDDLAFRTSTRMAYTLGVLDSQPKVAVDWMRIALPLARASRDPAKRALANQLLGNVLEEQGLYREAVTFYQRSLMARQRAFGPAHYLTSNSLRGLSAALAGSGRLEEAAYVATTALKTRMDALGDDHPLTAGALVSLATIIRRRGQCLAAEHLSVRAVAVFEAMPHVHHSSVAHALTALGQALDCQKKYEEADGVYYRALASARRSGDDLAADTARTMGSIAISLARRGKHRRAESLSRVARAGLEEALGEAHPDVANAVANIGHSLMQQGQLEEAEAMYREGLSLTTRYRGSVHPDVARSLHDLGVLFIQTGEHDQALDALSRAIEIHRTTLGPDHPEAAPVLVGLAEANLGLGRASEALLHAERAVSIVEASNTPPENRADAQFALARALRDTHGDTEHACALAHNAQQSYSAYGSDGDHARHRVEVWLLDCP